MSKVGDCSYTRVDAVEPAGLALALALCAGLVGTLR
jgi:hypothetical protein